MPLVVALVILVLILINSLYVAAEFAAVRDSTLALVRSLDAAGWERRGTANGVGVAARSLPYIIAGHELHHRAVLRERYGIA